MKWYKKHKITHKSVEIIGAIIREGDGITEGKLCRGVEAKFNNRMAWQWAETLVEIRRTLVDIRGTTK